MNFLIVGNKKLFYGAINAYQEKGICCAYESSYTDAIPWIRRSHDGEWCVIIDKGLSGNTKKSMLPILTALHAEANGMPWIIVEDNISNHCVEIYYPKNKKLFEDAAEKINEILHSDNARSQDKIIQDFYKLADINFFDRNTDSIMKREQYVGTMERVSNWIILREICLDYFGL